MWVNNYDPVPEGEKPTLPGVTIRYLSYTDNLPRWSYGYHHHEDIYELTFVMESSGFLLLANDKIPLKAGDIVIMPPQVLHSYTCEPEETMTYYAIWLDAAANGGEVESFLKGIGTEPAIVPAYKYLDYLKSSFRILMELHQLNEGVIDETHQSVCLGLFLLMKKIYQHRAMVVPLGHSSYASDVLWYINQHCSEPISLDSLAKHFNISASHLRRIFKEVYGTSPINYLIKRRIAMATDYLLKTDLSVAEIARQVGYENVAHFSHLFADRIGCTPGEFRERNQKQPLYGVTGTNSFV